jgi:hypothetical protein
MAEQGITDIALTEWLGWFLPAATPPDIVRALNAVARDGLQDPAMVASLANSALEPRHTTPEQCAALLREDYERWEHHRESDRLHDGGVVREGILMRLTGAQALVRALSAEQVAFAFGVVGGKLTPLLHAIQASGIRYVGTRHEANAAIMAAASFAGSGRIAVAMGEMGPGGLNLASGGGSPSTTTLRRC